MAYNSSLKTTIKAKESKAQQTNDNSDNKTSYRGWEKTTATTSCEDSADRTLAIKATLLHTYVHTCECENVKAFV